MISADLREIETPFPQRPVRQASILIENPVLRPSSTSRQRNVSIYAEPVVSGAGRRFLPTVY